MTQNPLVQKKICILGMFGVGKTSLIRRYVHDIFDDSYHSTIGVKVSQKRLPAIHNSSGVLFQYNFLIWDIEGFDKPSPQINNYFEGAQGAIVVGDLSRIDTLTGLPDIIESFHSINKDAAIMVAGNKRDVIAEAHPGVALLTSMCEEKGLPFFLTSAKSGVGVNDSFEKLGLLIAR